MILDIIALILIAVCIAQGIKRGFIKSIFGTFSVVIALVITIVTLDSATAFLKETDFGKSVYDKTNINVVGSFSQQGEGNSYGEIIGLDDLLEKAEETGSQLSERVGDMILKAITAVCLFVVYMLALKLLMHIFNILAKLPMISTFNKLGGVISGIINAYIVMIIFTCLLTALLSSTVGAKIALQLKDSVIVSLFCENNPLLKG